MVRTRRRHHRGRWSVLDVITEYLANEGYRPLAYRQGAGAYEFIEHEQPDAVILDIRMEHSCAGLAVLQRIRRDEATAAMPVVACTADYTFVAEWRRTLDGYRRGDSAV